MSFPITIEYFGCFQFLYIGMFVIWVSFCLYYVYVFLGSFVSKYVFPIGTANTWKRIKINRICFIDESSITSTLSKHKVTIPNAEQSSNTKDFNQFHH